jgi:hypothetical protein
MVSQDSAGNNRRVLAAGPGGGARAARGTGIRWNLAEGAL